MDKNLIIDVVKGSIAEELEIEKGDFLISIDGVRINDCIEYRYLETTERLELEIEKKSGETWIFEIEKEMDEPLGILYENALMDEVKTCQNKCIFCFVDQLPKNMRTSLYLKDDDSRLSFLMGNYLTLTNMTDREIETIIEYGISPIKVSVHTTNPELRKRMLKNKNADRIMSVFEKFRNTNIEIDCQVVLVPGYNDKSELSKTIFDLYELLPVIRSVAVVPVGITKHRKGLPDIRGLTRDECRENIQLINGMQKKFLQDKGTRFVYLSDEFYIRGEHELPDYVEYEDFHVLDNGVGMVRVFEREVDEALKDLRKLKVEKRISVLTGSLAYDFMREITTKISKKIDGIVIEVFEIKNDYFGRDVNVSGLITAADIISQVKGRLGPEVLIPDNMLKKDENVFLDDTALVDLEKELGVSVKPIEVNGYKFVKEIIGE
jgi:putative radical SAM enzyme (TIGR03279 family)